MKRYILFLMTIIISAAVSCKKADMEQPSFDGKIIFTLGQVTLNGKAIAGAYSPVTAGDIIETGKDSVCDLQIGEKSVFRVGKETRMIYSISKDTSAFELEKGWLAGITRKKFTEKGIYTITTPTVVASVRGTSYCIKVENPQSTYFCVCNGTIGLQGKGDVPKKDITAAHHAGARFSLENDGSLKIDEKAGMLYHGDDVIETLMTKINETIDWSVPDAH